MATTYNKGTRKVSSEISNCYSILSKKSQTLAPKIEVLLKGLSYKEAEDLLLTVAQSIKSISLITFE